MKRRMKKLSELDQKVLIATFVSSGNVAEAGRQAGISRQWASKLINEFKREQAGGPLDLDGVNYKARIKRKAIVALESGLDSHIEDPLRAGVLGLGALKEMNALADDGGGSFNEAIMGVPEEFAAMFGLIETPPEMEK